MPLQAAMKSPITTRVVLVLSVAVVAAALLSVGQVHEAIDRALDAVTPLFTTHPLLGGALFVLLAAVSAMLAFFSSALLVPAGIHAWGTWPTIALLWLGWLLGGMCAYALGRVLRRPLLPTRGAVRTLEHYAQRLPPNAGWPLVLLLQLALPSEVPGYLCGFLRVRFKIYVSALAVAELPYAIGAALAGDSVVRGHSAWLLGLAVLAVMAMLFALRLLRVRLERSARKQG
jgi:uncharacterized membrane protein YdjX (TVP38/TMEM64 family)